jgi:O-antigen/teichoic acid export membrane protein
MAHAAVRNTAYLTLGSIFQKIVSFVYFSIVAKSLGPEDTGKYVFALTFTTVFSILTDIGLSPALNRDTARTPANAEKNLHATLLLKIISCTLGYALVVGAVHLLGYPPEVRMLIYVSGITMVFDSIHLSLYAVLRGNQLVGYEAFGMVGSQIITLLLGGIFLFLHLPLTLLMAAFTIPSFLNVCWSGTMVWRKLHVHIFPRHIEKPRLIFMIKEAWAFAFAGIFARIYSYADTLLLSKLATLHAVGIYSIPNKIAFAFQFIPLALTASIYPAMSKHFVENKEKVREIFDQSFVYLSIISFPIAAGLFLLAEPLVLLAYGPEYTASVAPLKILMISMLFAFLGFPVGSALNACNKQKTQTAIVGGTVVVNVLANSILIPRMGVSGAACAAVLGNLFLTGVGLWHLHKAVTLHLGTLSVIVSKTLTATVLMGLIVHYGEHVMPWMATIPLGVAVYSVCLVTMGVITKQHWLLFQSLYRKNYEKTIVDNA